MTISPGERHNYLAIRFSRYRNDDPYVDEIHFGRTCQALLLENIGHQCDELLTQDINESNPFYIDFRDYYAKD